MKSASSFKHAGTSISVGDLTCDRFNPENEGLVDGEKILEPCFGGIEMLVGLRSSDGV